MKYSVLKFLNSMIELKQTSYQDFLASMEEKFVPNTGSAKMGNES